MTPEQLLSLMRQAQEPLESAMNRIEDQVGRMDQRLTAVDSRVNDLTGRLDRVELDLDAKLDEKIQAALAAAMSSKGGGSTQAPTSPRSSTSGSPPSSAASSTPEWRPGALLVKGWAPHGSPASERLSRSQAMALADRLMSSLPDRERQQVRLAPPYASNYQLTLRIAQGGDVWTIKELLCAAVDVHGIAVKDTPVKVTVEISPQRRQQFHVFFSAKRLLEGVCNEENSKWLLDVRSFQILLTDLNVLGRIPRNGSAFTWEPTELRKLDLEYKEGALHRLRRRKREGAEGGRSSEEHVNALVPDTDEEEGTAMDDAQIR